MDTKQYTIYMENRPYRVAFLIDPTQNADMIEVIVEFNREKWGGRFNPIFFTDGNSIDDGNWSNLKNYDPDIVYVVPSLSDELKKRIKTFLSPMEIIQHHSGQRFISIRNSPTSVVPTSSNLNKVSLGFPREEMILCFFLVDDDTPSDIRQFLSDNFGVVHEQYLNYSHIKRSRETVQFKDFKITTHTELNETLLELGDWRNKFIFQSQICSLPNTLKETHYNNDGEKFEVIIGESVKDKVYAWNRQLDVRHWMRTQITQLLLTEDIASNETIRPGLTTFINRYTSQVGNDGSRGTKLVSCSLNEAKLEKIKNELGRELRLFRGVSAKTDMPILDYRDHGLFHVGRGMDFHRANSNEEVIVIKEPNEEDDGVNGQSWFVDLYIEYRPEKFTYITGSTYWWQLPNRNSILRHCSFFNKPARINKHGTFSVLMTRRHQFSPDENILTVKIPEDRAIFHALFCGEKFDNIDPSDAAKFHSSPFYHMQRSDKGMYLSGVLQLFPNLSTATRQFEERYWRAVFEKMSNTDLAKDEGTRVQVLGAIKKMVGNGKDLSTDEGQGELAKKLFGITKGINEDVVDLDYKTLCEMADIETKKYNQKPSGQSIPFDESEFTQALSELVEANILLMGVKPRCPYCGYRIWYHLDKMTTKITCEGCSYEFNIEAEVRWHYRLNSLVRAAVSKHGTVPLLLTLGEIMEDARSSGMFISSHELLNKEGDGLRRVREVDLICIKDGKFIIGEIKRSLSLFKKKDFADMTELAKQVRPDVVVFSSMDEKPNKFVAEEMEKMKIELKSLEIEVVWHQIRYWAFTPHPVR